MRTPPKRSARLGERKSEEKPPTQRVGGMKFFGGAAALGRRGPAVFMIFLGMWGGGGVNFVGRAGAWGRGAPAFIMIFQEMCRGGLRFSKIYGIVKAA